MTWNDARYDAIDLAIDRAIADDQPSEMLRLIRCWPDLPLDTPSATGWTLLTRAIDCECRVHTEPDFLGPPRANLSLILVAAGADPTASAEPDGTAISLARRLNHVEFLRAVGEPCDSELQFWPHMAANPRRWGYIREVEQVLRRLRMSLSDREVMGE